MSNPSEYLLPLPRDYLVSSVNPFITELTTSNSNINGATFTPSLGDWIYYLFWDPTATYTVTPSSTVSSLNFVVVGGGSGGNAGSEQFGLENSNGVGITLAGGSSGAVCAGSVSVTPSNYTITVGAGGFGSNQGYNPPSAGTSSSILAVDGGSIACSGGSPAPNVTGIAGIVSTTSSNDLSSISIISTNNSNNTPSFGIGGTDVNFGSSNAYINGGPGLSINFADSLGSFLFGGGGGGGNDYEDSIGATQGGNGSNGLGGQGGISSEGAGGGGGGGGMQNSINVQYIGSACDGIAGSIEEVPNYYSSDDEDNSSGDDDVNLLGGNGGNANVGGGGGGGGAIQNGNGGQGGNGLVLLYYQIPNTTVSNGLTIHSQVGSINIELAGTGTTYNTRSILPDGSSKSSYVLEFKDSENHDVGIWLDLQDIQGGFYSPYDPRLQQNVAPIQPSLDKMLQLKPLTFTIDSDKVHAGFKSDEISKVFPSVISRGKYSETIKDNIQGVNMTALMPMVVKSIQEINTVLNTKVDTLNATVKTLKTELDTVKQNNDKLTVEDVVDFAKKLWCKYKNKK